MSQSRSLSAAIEMHQSLLKAEWIDAWLEQHARGADRERALQQRATRIALS
jgi:hypothetical protein